MQVLQRLGRDSDDWFQRYVDITASFIEYDWDSILELANALYERSLDAAELRSWWEARPRSQRCRSLEMYSRSTSRSRSPGPGPIFNPNPLL